MSASSTKATPSENWRKIPTSSFCSATRASVLSLPEVRLLSAPDKSSTASRFPPPGITAGSVNLGQWEACQVITAPKPTIPAPENTKKNKRKSKMPLPSVYELTQQDVTSARSCTLGVSKFWHLVAPAKPYPDSLDDTTKLALSEMFPDSQDPKDVFADINSDAYLDWENSAVETFQPTGCALGMRFNRTDQWQGGPFEKYRALFLLDMRRGAVARPMAETNVHGEETELETTETAFTCTILGIPCDPTAQASITNAPSAKDTVTDSETASAVTSGGLGIDAENQAFLNQDWTLEDVAEWERSLGL